MAASRTYLLCGLTATDGKLKFRSYGNPYERARREIDTQYYAGKNGEVAIQAILPWETGLEIDKKRLGHYILENLAQTLTSPVDSDVRLTRHELTWLAMDGGTEFHDMWDWANRVMLPKLQALRPAPGVQALSVAGIPVHWRIPISPAPFVESIRATLSTGELDSEDVAYINTIFEQRGGGEPIWSLGTEGAALKLSISKQLLEVAGMTKDTTIHQFALNNIRASDNEVRLAVFKYLDSPDPNVVDRVLYHLSKWSNMPERRPVDGIAKQESLRKLAKTWKDEGPGAILIKN